MMLEPGVVLGGDFRVVSRLGEGGMGTVWIAEQLSVGRKRALKVMRSDIVHDARLRERFAQEAKIGATIHSDHVVEVIAAGIDETYGVPWIAMELLEGQDLGAVIAERGPLSREEIFDIVEQLCHGLAAAHGVGVVHRDLKPENVFLARPRRSGGPQFDVKVLDFGIAKVAAEARATTAGSGIIGTPLYMAPEQAEAGSPASPSTDVWALALIVYRMLTGRHFWRSTRDGASSITALLREVLFDPIPKATERADLDGVADRIPAGFDAWMARCLERDPARRFGGAAEAFALLGGVLRVDPAAAPLVVPFHDDADFKLGRASDIMVIRWRATPVVSSVAAMDSALARAARDLGGKPFYVMPVVDAARPAADANARDALAAVMVKHDHLVIGVTYVVLGGGFQSALLRGIITGLTLVARPRAPTKVLATTAAALDWLSSRRDEGAGARSALHGAIDRFCA